MSIVTYFVNTASNYLESSSQTQFGSVAATVGTLITVSATLVVIMVLLNAIFQVRSIDGRTSFWLAVKITLIALFATNWAQFNYLSSSILSGIDSIAGALVASVGGGTPGPSGTFAEEFDQLIGRFGEYLNAAGENLNWMAGAILSNMGVFLLSILGGLAAFILIASRLMIALLVGLAPIMIFLTLFDVTKDYFTRWLSSLISFAIYPIVLAGVFATIIGVANALIARLGDPAAADNIGALLPFFMMILMAKGFLIATPFIVRSISGNIVMPAMSAGLGGSYEFGRAAFGSRHAQSRQNMGTASGAEIAGIAAYKAARRGITSLRGSGGGEAAASPGTGAKMQRMKERSDRLGN